MPPSALLEPSSHVKPTLQVIVFSNLQEYVKTGMCQACQQQLRVTRVSVEIERQGQGNTLSP